MDEEVKIRMGLDASGVASALRSTERQLHEFGHHLKEQFSEVGHELVAALSIGAGIATIEKAFHRVTEIKRQSETLGSTTDFVQDIQNVGKASGIASENVDKMLNKFIGTLKPGQDVEEEFYKMADNIATIQDPVERAGAAIGVFGDKLGPKFISLLAKGSSGIKEMASEWSKFSKTEIEDLEHAHQQIERISNSIQIYTGKVISWIAEAARYWGARSGGASNKGAVGAMGGEGEDKVGMAAARQAAQIRDAVEAQKDYKAHLDESALKGKTMSREDKLALLESRRDSLQNMAIESKSMREFYDLRKQQADVEQEIADIKKEQLDHTQKIAEAEAKHAKSEYDKYSKAKSNYDEARKAPYEHSLEDLANQPGTFFSMGGYRFGPGVMQAKQIQNLRQQATQAGLSGNYDRADALRKQADSMFDNLAKADPYLKNPQQKMSEELEKQTTILQDFADDGLGVYGVGD